MEQLLLSLLPLLIIKTASAESIPSLNNRTITIETTPSVNIGMTTIDSTFTNHLNDIDKLPDTVSLNT